MLIAGTQSAMFDGRRVPHPTRFDPDRPPSAYMLFGHGLHWCAGAAIAEAQITQTLKALLVRDGLRRAPGRAGRLARLGPFPQHLVVRFAA
jgi:cytochrome P450